MARHFPEDGGHGLGLFNIFFNGMLTSAFISFAIAQLAKPFTDWIEFKRWDWRRSFGSGGMPSSHTSTIAGLTTAVAVHSGLESNAFAICAVLLLVVAYDATGVRREAGKHAALLNALMNDRQPIAQEGSLRPSQELLKVHLGHTPLQVAAGGVLGVLVGFIVQSQYGRAAAATIAAAAPGSVTS